VVIELTADIGTPLCELNRCVQADPGAATGLIIIALIGETAGEDRGKSEHTGLESA